MWKSARTVVSVLIATGVIGILAIIFGPFVSGMWGRFIENLGLSFIVASIVGISVELYVRGQMRIQMNRMLKDIGTDVFQAALGHEFPESIWKQVTAHLLLNPVIRRDLTIDYHLENLQDGSEQLLKTQICISYTVSNLNTVQQCTYPLACSIDRCTHVKYRDVTRFNSIKINEEEISLADCGIDKYDAEITCRHDIKLNPNEEKRISIHAESVYRNHETIPFSMTDPTENFIIKVSKPTNIAVAVDTLHPREERLHEEPTASPESNKTWRISGGLLPGNGVSIRWFPL